MTLFKKLLAAAAITTLAPIGAQAAPIMVDLELALVIDVSGSINNADFNVQRTGYVNAFNSPEVQNAILAGDKGSIAVTVVWFGTNAHHWAPGWQLIDSATSAEAFATTLGATNRPESGSTNIAAGINLASSLFGTGDYRGDRLVIDVSGDGSQNQGGCDWTDMNCAILQQARDNFLGGDGDRVINALWIDDRNFFGISGQTINSLTYGQTNVIGDNIDGSSHFQLAVTNFEDFGDAIKTKLVAEISSPPPVGVPEPATLALLGLGLAGLGALRRRKLQA